MFKWKEIYSVNVERIDKQHKRLFQLGEKIYEIISLDDEYDHYDEIMSALDELKEYTIYHFGCEEELMEKYDAEKLEEHKIEHKAFVMKITGIDEDDVDYNQKEVLMDLLKFILNWIEGHILRTDMKYKECFNSQGIY